VSLVGEADGALPAIRDILVLKPDLVLLDVNLADGNGFDVLNGVHVAAPEIDFCMLSTFADSVYRPLAGELGAREFLDSGELARVRELVARRVAARRQPTSRRPL
jgi:DNA-binding NarL/FixJ family response regulator